MTDMAGWVGLRAWAKSKGVNRHRLLRRAKVLDAGTGRVLQRAPQTGEGLRPGKWLINARRLETMGGPTRQKIDETVDRIPLELDDLRAELRELRRRVSDLERARAGQGGTLAAGKVGRP